MSTGDNHRCFLFRLDLARFSSQKRLKGKELITLGRKNKLETTDDDRSYQKKRAEQLKKQAYKLPKLSPTPPSFLSDVAKTVYKNVYDLVSNSDLIVKQDAHLIVSFSMVSGMMRESYEHLKEEGSQQKVYTVVQTADGDVIDDHRFTGWKPNPAYKNVLSAISSLEKIAKELGLTPQSRATLLNLAVTDSDDNSDVDPMQSLKDVLNGKPGGGTS